MGCTTSKNESSDSSIIRKALLIGINYMHTQSELRGCINDTENLKHFLVSNRYFNNDEFIMMNDYKLGKLNPTKRNILNQLNGLVRFAKKNPEKQIQMLISYSGHGSSTVDRSGDEDDGYDEMLCPLDYETNGFIVDDDIKRDFIDLLPSNVKLFMLVDACHSGTICDLKYEYFIGSTLRTKSRRFTVDSNCNVILISGARDIETAADAFIYDPTNKRYEYQGAMTASFIANYNDTISYQDLIMNMRSWLKLKKYRQVPQLSSGKSINVDQRCILSEFKDS